MKIKTVKITKQIYVCPFCGGEFDSEEEAVKCAGFHAKPKKLLTWEDGDFTPKKRKNASPYAARIRVEMENGDIVSYRLYKVLETSEKAEDKEEKASEGADGSPDAANEEKEEVSGPESANEETGAAEAENPEEGAKAGTEEDAENTSEDLFGSLREEAGKKPETESEPEKEGGFFDDDGEEDGFGGGGSRFFDAFKN